MSFSFRDNGTSPIARVRCGKKIKYIFLDEREAEPLPQHSGPVSILDEKLDPITVEQVAESLAKGLSLREMYNVLEASSGGPSAQPAYFTHYELAPGEQIEAELPDTSTRIFIAGEAGCGKSTIAAQKARQYLAMFPEGKVFMFLRQEDDAYAGIPRTEIILDFNWEDPNDPDAGEQNRQDLDALLSGDIGLDMLQGGLVIFDDADNLQDKKLLSAIHKLMNDAATNGRKRDIYTIYISHLLMNYAHTRVMLNEANQVYMFPGCGTRQIENFLKTYASMKTKEAERLAAIKSRWVMLSRKRPRYIVHEKGLFLL